MQRPYVIDADVVYDDVAQVGEARRASWKGAIKKNLMLPFCGARTSLSLAFQLSPAPGAGCVRRLFAVRSQMRHKVTTCRFLETSTSRIRSCREN